MYYGYYEEFIGVVVLWGWLLYMAHFYVYHCLRWFLLMVLRMRDLARSQAAERTCLMYYPINRNIMSPILNANPTLFVNILIIVGLQCAPITVTYQVILHLSLNDPWQYFITIFRFEINPASGMAVTRLPNIPFNTEPHESHSALIELSGSQMHSATTKIERQTWCQAALRSCQENTSHCNNKKHL